MHKVYHNVQSKMVEEMDQGKHIATWYDGIYEYRIRQYDNGMLFRLFRNDILVINIPWQFGRSIDDLDDELTRLGY